MDLLISTILFITIEPFSNHVIFALLIVTVFVLSLFLVKKRHEKALEEFKTSEYRLVSDDSLDNYPASSTPGILMSLGIIGTFFLISQSLGGIEGSLAIEKIMMIIKSEIAPAFSISAFGILASIIYPFIENIWIDDYDTKVKELIKDNNVESFQSISLMQHDITKKMLDQLINQSSAFSEMKNFGESLQSLSHHMDKFGKASESLDKTFNPEILGGVISNALMSQMKPVLEKIQTMTAEVSESSQNVDQNSKEIKNFLEVDLKEQVVSPLQESMSSMTLSVNSIERALQATTEAMSETNKGFDKLNLGLEKLENSQSHFVENLNEVLERQKDEFKVTTEVIVNTYKTLTDTVSEQIDVFNNNSESITRSFSGLSDEMQTFLNNYKSDYQEVLSKQEKAIESTTEKSISILKTSGEVLVNTVSEASNKLQSTLDGVDEALVKTSSSIKSELEKFKNGYTDSLKGFLDSQEDILNNVFATQTEKLSGVVDAFRDSLESDVLNRKELNNELDELIKRTNAFISGTNSLISSGYEQNLEQLSSLITDSNRAQYKLQTLIEDLSKVSESGHTATEKLVNSLATVQKQFNDNQNEVLTKYQTQVDEHLAQILSYLTAIAQSLHEASRDEN